MRGRITGNTAMRGTDVAARARVCKHGLRGIFPGAPARYSSCETGGEASNQLVPIKGRSRVGAYVGTVASRHHTRRHGSAVTGRPAGRVAQGRHQAPRHGLAPAPRQREACP